MKIMMGTHYFASHKGGIEIVAEQLFRGLAAKGHEVTWVAGDSTPPPAPLGASRAVGLKVLNFVERKIGLPFPVPTLEAIGQIRAAINHADVVVIHDCLYLSNIAAFVISKHRGVPLLIVQHIGFVPYKNPILRLLMKTANSIVTRPMLSHAEQVVFISETTMSHFGSLRLSKTPEVIFNGVDTQVYRKLDPGETKSALRRNYDLPEDRPILLYVGRFVEKKGLSILKQMVSQRPNYTWAFAGWGPLNPGSWKQDNVRVFSGLVGASLAALYRACDAFVLPSTGEGFPLVIQEALASGLPVVCSSEIALADSAMTPFLMGIPVSRGDDERTAAEFLQGIDLIGSGAAQRYNSEERRTFAISRYSWDVAIDGYLKIMTRLVPSLGPELKGKR